MSESNPSCQVAEEGEAETSPHLVNLTHAELDYYLANYERTHHYNLWHNPLFWMLGSLGLSFTLIICIWLFLLFI